ncbi:PIN domain-containing protein [Butyricicoccus sp. Marseille-Q5471]|uniref:PIN domain-containing protein n=1 Tax=Butyricicoccus sp. Marseille-Q5471 TaxID=3039493 RepID=UPI0024BC2E2D|nr:PIN domain-containing protein [Butyricicoccus sp. Marseille-Q5471]
MFKYPLAVTIDTNIFDAAKFDLGDASTLRILGNYVKSGKIKVVLSDIVVRESKKHIADQVNKVCGIVRTARTDALNISTEHLIGTIGLNEILRIVKNKNELISKGEEMFDDFLRTINAEILGADLIEVYSILSDYFETRPPFEEGEKKKSEFPDAFIVQQIRKRFGETEKVVIVSNDKGFVRACQESENHLFFNSLGALYNAISKEDASYDETIAVIKELQLRISASVKKYIEDNENIDLHGLSYDKDGIESGYDYNEFYLHSISEVTFSVHSVDEISEKTSIVTLSCKAGISADCYYEDYANAPWDPEEKEYVFVDMIKMREEHKARFGCRIEIDREAKTFKVFPFTVVLGGDSRSNRYEVEEHPSEDDDEEIRDMDREALGFQPLGSYESYLEDNLPDSPFYAEIIAKFDVINSLYRKYDDCCISFDELLSELNADASKEAIRLIYRKLLEVSDIPRIAYVENITDSEVEKIQAWASAQYERVSEIADTNTLPDAITFGETIIIRGVDGSNAALSIGDNQINPDEGSEEIIDICFSIGDENTASGYIKLTVGYLNFDEDGGAADGISDEIEYEYDDLLKELDRFIHAQSCIVEKDNKIAEIISEAINLGIDNKEN